jgi:serine phosphatase RsbU (regulator of sigma subunit)/tetratricopeptide (TPR) repeat protein
MVNQIDFAGGTEHTETPSVTSEGHEQEFPALTSAAVSPLIGRNAELRLLEDRWEQAQEGQSQVVLVLGEAGLGKSRLVRTVVRLIRESAVSADHPPSQVVEWRCAEHFQNSELHPVSDFMNRFLGFGAEDSPSARFERLARHLEEYGLNSPEDVGLFAKLLFLPEDDRYLAGGLTPAREREETFRVVRQWLDACSAKRPTLFIIEDLHWSDASTLEFLSQLIEGGQSGQLLTLLTFRPEFKVPWPSAPHQTFLALNRLSRRQVTEWMRTGSKIPLPDSLITQVYQRTGGVPLLVEEFTRMVRESTVAAPTTNAAPTSGAASTNPVPREIPATLQDLVLARLDRMGCDREIVLLTSTLGHRFDYDLLAASALIDDERLQAELGKLVSADVLFSKGQWPHCSYVFKHALLEEALYTAIDEQKRREFHQRIAETMEARFPKVAETQPELLAEHFTNAGLVLKAIGYCLKAGLRSKDRFANVEAVSHFRKGIQLLEKLEPSAARDALELELLGPLGTAFIAWRGYADPEVGPILSRAHALCERVGETPQVFAIMWGNFAYHIVRGDFRMCAVLAEEAIAFAERLDQPGILMEALFLRGITCLYRGDFNRARNICAEVIARFDDRERTASLAKLIGEDPGITCRCYLSLALWHLGLADQALELSRQTVELARSIDHVFSLEYALHHSGWLHQHSRLGTQTQVAAEEQVQIAGEQGFLFWEATGTLYTAGGLLLQGRMERGLRLLENGLQAYRATGAQLGLPYYLSMLVDAWIRAGRFAEAESALTEALALAEKNDERFQEAELYRLKGELLLAQSNDQAGAEQWFRRSLGTAERQGSKAWTLRTTMSLVRLWQKQGDREKAFTALSSVYGSFTEGHATPDLADAATLNGSLLDERMRAEFAAGLNYVRDCIPAPMHGAVSVDWRYVPASTLGGDIIGYHWLDRDHLAFYLIDVTGHGLDSALLSVTLTNIIRTGALSGADMKHPDQVLAQLNEAFRGQEHGNKYFTIWYGVYQSTTRTLTWAGGGHHPSVVLVPGQPDPSILTSEGPMMGVLRTAEFPAQSCHIPAESRLLIFSDGVFEVFRDKRQMWNLTDCIAYLASVGQECGNLMDQLLNHVQQLRGAPYLNDDFSIIEARFH